MSQHSDINDTINSLDTTDEQTSNNTSAPIDTDTNASHEIEPGSDKHIRIVNTFMKRRTHMNKNAELALTAPEFSEYLVNTVLIFFLCTFSLYFHYLLTNHLLNI